MEVFGPGLTDGSAIVISQKGSVNTCSVYCSINRSVRSWVKGDKDRLPSSEQESSRVRPGPEAAVHAQGCDKDRLLKV